MHDSFDFSYALVESFDFLKNKLYYMKITGNLLGGL